MIFYLLCIYQPMTPNRQQLTEEQRATIKNDYLCGLKPAAIAKKIHAKPATVRQAIWREGLTKERNGIKEAAARTAEEVLHEARKRHAKKLVGILDKQIESLELDAGMLLNGWALVEDAAGASSLMRAKGLLQDRTLGYFGIELPDDGQPKGSQFSINMFIAHGEPVEKSEPRPVA